MSRTIKILKPVTTYEEVEVDLLKYLRDNTAEVVIMRETNAIEIRFPTRCHGVTNCIGYINLKHVDETVSDLWDLISCNRHDEIFEKYQDHICMMDHVSGAVVDMSSKL